MIQMKIPVNNVDKLSAGIQAGIGEAVMAMAFIIEGQAKRSIMIRKSRYKRYYSVSGRVVKRRKGGKVVGGRVRRIRREHWSSAPGDPPNTDTGFLATSIHAKRVTRYKAQVRCSARYGLPLELGWHTKSGKRVPARPFMRPPVEANRTRFNNMIKGVLRDYK